MNKRLWIVLGVIVVVFFGGLMWYNSTIKEEPVVDYSYVDELDGSKMITKEDVIAAVEKTENRTMTDEEKDNIIADHYIGNTDSKVVVVKWEDFACSHCQMTYEETEKMIDEYSDRVLFVTRDFNLGYPSSDATLKTANAVAKLGGNEAFHKISDLLFQDEKWIMTTMPSGWKDILNGYVEEAGVDVDEYTRAYNNASINGIDAKLERDARLADKMGVTGTPTWMVNGEIVENADVEAISNAIDAALKAAEVTEE